MVASYSSHAKIETDIDIDLFKAMCDTPWYYRSVINDVAICSEPLSILIKIAKEAALLKHFLVILMRSISSPKNIYTTSDLR